MIAELALAVSASINAWTLLAWTFRQGGGVKAGDWITGSAFWARAPKHGDRKFDRDLYYLECE